MKTSKALKRYLDGDYTNEVVMTLFNKEILSTFGNMGKGRKFKSLPKKLRQRYNAWHSGSQDLIRRTTLPYNQRSSVSQGLGTMERLKELVARRELLKEQLSKCSPDYYAKIYGWYVQVETAIALEVETIHKDDKEIA